MSDNQGFILFPEVNTKFIYLMVFIFCSLMRRLVPRVIETKFKSIKNYEKIEEINYNKNKCYFDLLSNFIADFLTGIVILINKFNNSKSKNISPSRDSKAKSEMTKKFFFYLSIIAIIDFIAQLCLFFYSYIIPKGGLLDNYIIREENLYFVVLIDIISRYCFSRYFLSSYFYRHHIASIFITIIGFIPLTLKNLIDLKLFNDPNETIYLILFIFMTIIYSLEDVLNKICLNQLILRPYELMFYKSLFQIILVFIFTIYAIEYNDLISYVRDNFSFLKVLYRFSFIISNIFRTWSLITIIELLNPNHLSVLKSSEFIVLFIFISIFNNCTGNKENDNIIYIFGTFCCLFSLIGSAIHNELIIINKWGLLECTDYYKAEIKGTPIEEDLEGSVANKNNETIDSFLGGSIDDE